MSNFGNEPVYVYLPEERTFGIIVGPIGAYYTRIKYTYQGIEYDALVENDDYIMLGEWDTDNGDE